MIYLNNAATSWPKPESVAKAVEKKISEIPGHANRGGFSVKEDSSWRGLLSEKLKITDHNTLVGCTNATDALNKGLQGFNFNKRDKILSTMAEHNSVLRPLYYLEKTKKVQSFFCPINKEGRIEPGVFEKMIREIKPKMVVFTHASNVTGAVNDAESLTKIAKENKAKVFLDASQTLGLLEVFPEKWGIDLMAFTGHKYLLGPQGTGGLYVSKEISLTPVWVGGTGIHSDDPEMPMEMPLRLEAGTQNEPSFAGLAAALYWEKKNPIDLDILKLFVDDIEKSLERLGVSVIKVTGKRTPVISFTIKNWLVEDVGEILERSFEIITRTGLHCAPLIHKSLGTVPQGTIRISLSRFTKKEEVENFLDAIESIVKES